MSAATDEAIATLSGAGAVVLLAVAQYLLSASNRYKNGDSEPSHPRRNRKDRHEDSDSDDSD